MFNEIRNFREEFLITVLLDKEEKDGRQQMNLSYSTEDDAVRAINFYRRQPDVCGIQFRHILTMGFRDDVFRTTKEESRRSLG